MPGSRSVTLRGWVALACGLVAFSCGADATETASTADDHPRDDDDAGIAGASVGGRDASRHQDEDPGDAQVVPSAANDGSAEETADEGADLDGLDALPVTLDGEPLHYRYVRLTHSQWGNSVRDNLRLESASHIEDGLLSDVRYMRFSNNELMLGPSLQLVSDYQQAAESLVALLRDDSELLANVYDGTDPEEFVAAVGQRFYRRPLSDETRATYLQLFEAGASLADDEFVGGATLVLQALLQSPNFLYRIETAPPDEALDGYEVATKLAYFITDSTPSDELLAAASRGELESDESLAAHVDQLLETDRTRRVMRTFHGERHRLASIESIVRSEDLGYDSALNEDLKEAAYRFFDRIFTDDFGLEAILTSTEGYVTPRLADLYEVAAPAETFELRDLGPSRVGYFSQVAHLMLHGYGDTPDSIGRGVAIASDVLCAEVPPEADAPVPPPLAPDPSQTNRERVTQATSEPECAGCHAYLNPLGFAFENFDGLGRERAIDNGKPVDASGQYPFIEGVEEFENAAELMHIIARGEQAHRCYAKHLVEYGLAREVDLDDEPLIDSLAESSLDAGESLKSLIRRIAISSTFRTRRGE